MVTEGVADGGSANASVERGITRQEGAHCTRDKRKRGTEFDQDELLLIVVMMPPPSTSEGVIEVCTALVVISVALHGIRCLSNW